jgi:hypothetical protein
MPLGAVLLYVWQCSEFVRVHSPQARAASITVLKPNERTLAHQPTRRHPVSQPVLVVSTANNSVCAQQILTEVVPL